MTYAAAANLLGSERRYSDVKVRDGVTVRLQSLTEYEKAKIDSANIDYVTARVRRESSLKSRARMICACVVDGEGKRVFTDSDVDRVAREMDSRDSDIIYRGCLKHVGGDVADYEKLVGNSEATVDDDSQ